jgi:hypothetical protein
MPKKKGDEFYKKDLKAVKKKMEKMYQHGGGWADWSEGQRRTYQAALEHQSMLKATKSLKKNINKRKAKPDARG